MKQSGRDVILFPSIGGKDQYNFGRDKSNSSLHNFSNKETKQSPLQKIISQMSIMNAKIVSPPPKLKQPGFTQNRALGTISADQIKSKPIRDYTPVPCGREPIKVVHASKLGPQRQNTSIETSRRSFGELSLTPKDMSQSIHTNMCRRSIDVNEYKSKENQEMIRSGTQFAQKAVRTKEIILVASDVLHTDFMKLPRRKSSNALSTIPNTSQFTPNGGFAPAGEGQILKREIATKGSQRRFSSQKERN